MRFSVGKISSEKISQQRGRLFLLPGSSHKAGGVKGAVVQITLQ